MPGGSLTSYSNQPSPARVFISTGRIRQRYRVSVDFAEARQDSLIDSLDAHAESLPHALAAAIEMRRTGIEARMHPTARTAFFVEPLVIDR